MAQNLDSLDTNLLQSAKRRVDAPPESDAAIRRKNIFKKVAYAIFFFWALVFFTVLKVPDSLITNSILNSLNQNTPYQWQAETVGLKFFPLPHLRFEKLALEPKIIGAGLPLSLDELRIYPNPFSLIPLWGGSSFGGSFRAAAYKGVLSGSMYMGGSSSIRLETDSLDLAQITPLVNAGIDVKGIVSSLAMKLSLPNQRMSLADGDITLKGKNFFVDPASFQTGFVLPILNLGDVDVQATARRGQVKIEKFKVGGSGKDLEVQITSGTIILADVSLNTRYELHLKIKPAPAIQTTVPGLVAMLESMATKQADGFYAMKLQGTLGSPGFPAKD